MDRVLMAGRYVIPIYYGRVSLIAHKAHLKYPDYLPFYGDPISFLPDVWWVEKLHVYKALAGCDHAKEVIHKIVASSSLIEITLCPIVAS